MGVRELRKRHTVKEDVSIYRSTLSNLVLLEDSLIKRIRKLPSLLMALFIPLLSEENLKLLAYSEQLPVERTDTAELETEEMIVFLEAYSEVSEFDPEESFMLSHVFKTALRFVWFTLSNEEIVLLKESAETEDLGYFDYSVSYDSEREKEVVELQLDSSSEFKRTVQDSYIIR